MKFTKAIACSALVFCSQAAFSGTDIYFNPLTQSATVASPNHPNELTGPWIAPAGVTQVNLTSMAEIEAAIAGGQSTVRVSDEGTGGRPTSASMWDMVAYDDSGKYIFIPHETLTGAGVTRYNIEEDYAEVLFQGNEKGLEGDWSEDWGAFDPSTFTPNGTLLLGEEWSGQGRIMEVLNPMADPADIEIRELESIANVSHEGLRFSNDEQTLYYVDEFNSGSLYKFVMTKKGDYTKGQTFVLAVNRFDGDSSAYWNEGENETAQRTGWAQWVPLTNRDGTKNKTQTNPFKNGFSRDPRTSPDEVFGGRMAADEAGATPFGRPEDMEVGTLKNGREVVYFAATSENTVYSVEMVNKRHAIVREFVKGDVTPKNKGFTESTGYLNSPDNLAQDALGNIYIIEDAPNSSNIGGDIWFARDIDGDGVAESMDHFLSIQVDGAEATGMIFNPVKPTEFVVAVQHPDSTNLSEVEEGMGDALWKFDISKVVPPVCEYIEGNDGQYDYHKHVRTCSHNLDTNFIDKLEYWLHRCWKSFH
jgi:hypothetical protein